MYNNFNKFCELSKNVDIISKKEDKTEFDIIDAKKTVHAFRNQLQTWILTIIKLMFQGNIVQNNILEIYGEGAINLKIDRIKDLCNEKVINDEWNRIKKENSFFKDIENKFYIGSKNDSPRRFNYCSIISIFYLLIRVYRDNMKYNNNMNIVIELLCKLLKIKYDNSKDKIMEIEDEFKKFILGFQYVNSKKTPILLNIVNILCVFIDYYTKNMMFMKDIKYINKYYEYVSDYFLDNKFFKFHELLKDKLNYHKNKLNNIGYNIDIINEINIINDVFIDNISFLSKIDGDNIESKIRDINFFFNYILKSEFNCEETDKYIMGDIKKDNYLYRYTFILCFNSLQILRSNKEMNINLDLFVIEKIKKNEYFVKENNKSTRNYLERIIFSDISQYNLDNIDEARVNIQKLNNLFE